MENKIELILWKQGDTRYALEAQMQEAQIAWFWNVIGEPFRRMVFAVNNNSAGGVRGTINKTLGVTKGVSDLIYISFEEVVFIENKQPGGVQSPEQIDFMNKVLLRGHRYALCESFEGFKKFIMKEIVKHEH